MRLFDRLIASFIAFYAASVFHLFTKQNHDISHILSSFNRTEPPAPSSSMIRHHLVNFSQPRLTTQQNDIRQRQIENFVNGSGIAVSIHITHHAGTTLCTKFGRVVGAPAKFCNHPSMEQTTRTRTRTIAGEEAFPDYDPWNANETSHNIDLVRKAGFRFVGWEHRNPPSPTFHVTDWENPDLVSILVIREPISRLLAGDGFVASTFPGVSAFMSKKEEIIDNDANATQQQAKDNVVKIRRHEWFRFSHHRRNDNKALRILSGNNFERPISGEDVSAAKDLISRFTFVLDQACFDDNLNALAELLNVSLASSDPQGQHHTKKPKRRLSNAERIPFDDIYQYLLDLNSKDIELYQWAKQKSLVQCMDKGHS